MTGVAEVEELEMKVRLIRLKAEMDFWNEINRNKK